MNGMERAVAECGQWWFLCGPSMDLRTPGYWIGSIAGSVVWFVSGFIAGRKAAHHATPQAGEQEQP